MVERRVKSVWAAPRECSKSNIKSMLEVPRDIKSVASEAMEVARKAKSASWWTVAGKTYLIRASRACFGSSKGNSRVQHPERV